MPILFAGFNSFTIKYLLYLVQYFRVLMRFANGSIYIWPQYVNKSPFQLVKVFPSTLPHLSSISCSLPPSLYPGSTFALSSYFGSPRCIDNFQQKYNFSLFYRAKNLIAESSIRLCFTGVENNKQGGGLRSRRSPWDYCSKEIWYDYRKQ